jgi:pentatricopeptide repeat domain-containing protein 1
MQSPLIENISQKVFSSLKQNLEQTFESSLENKENYIPNISSKNHLNLKFETNKAFNRENPQKNAEKFSISKQNLENLETCWNQEIQELIEKIEAFDFNSSKINENFLSFSICTKSEITENSLENKFSQNQQANEASNLNDLSDKIGAENACDLANCLDIERNSSVLDKLENVTEKVKSHSAPYDNENFKEKPKQTSINGLKQHFRSLFFKLEKLLEIQKETKMLNFTETNFSENSEQSNFLFAENKNNILNFNNYNSTNQKNESENSNSNFPLNSLLTKITEICIEKKFFCEIMNFYLRSANEAKAIDLFLIKNIINFHDYEEAVFFLAEDLTRKLSKIELLFQILQFTSQNFVFNLYPVFSVCLHKLVKFNFIQEAFILKNYMLHFKLEISSVALNSLLEALGKSGRLEDAANLIKEIENANFLHFFDSCFTDSNSDLNNKNNFSKLSMQAGLNQISYGILIKHLCKSNLIDTALVHYEYLKANKLIKDEVIFNLLIDGCSKSSNLAQIISIYQDMLDFEIKPSIVTFNTIIDSYVRAKDFISAWNIYEEIKNFGCVPDKFTFSTLFRGIRNLAHKEYLEKAFVLLEELNKSNNSIDVILINVLIDSCIWLKDEKSLVKIFSNAVNGFYKNLSPDIITFNTFIKGCAQLYLFEEAKKAFNILLSKQDSIKPNDVSFNTMIDVYVRSENLNLVWDLLDLMKKYGIKPDNFTYSTIIKGINKKSNFNASNNFNKNLNNYDSDEAELEMAFKLFENVKANSKPDEILYNCIMDACLRFEKIDKMMEYHVEMMKVKIFL